MLHPDVQSESILVCDDLTCKLAGFTGAQDTRERVRYEMTKQVHTTCINIIENTNSLF